MSSDQAAYQRCGCGALRFRSYVQKRSPRRCRRVSLGLGLWTLGAGQRFNVRWSGTAKGRAERQTGASLARVARCVLSDNTILARETLRPPVASLSDRVGARLRCSKLRPRSVQKFDSKMITCAWQQLWRGAQLWRHGDTAVTPLNRSLPSARIR